VDDFKVGDIVKWKFQFPGQPHLGRWHRGIILQGPFFDEWVRIFSCSEGRGRPMRIDHLIKVEERGHEI